MTLSVMAVLELMDVAQEELKRVASRSDVAVGCLRALQMPHFVMLQSVLYSSITPIATRPRCLLGFKDWMLRLVLLSYSHACYNQQGYVDDCEMGLVCPRLVAYMANEGVPEGRGPLDCELQTKRECVCIFVCMRVYVCVRCSITDAHSHKYS